MKIHPFLLIAILFQAGCTLGVGVKTVNMDSDPREQMRAHMQDENEESNIEAFIAEHPELSPQMKKDLRSGSLSRHEALEQLKKK